MNNGTNQLNNNNQQGNTPQQVPGPSLDVVNYLPPSARKKSSAGKFFLGLFLGILVGALALTLVFLLSYRKTGRFRLTGSGAAGEGEILDQTTLDKIELLNQYINDYYYKDTEVSVEDRQVGLFNGLMESLDDVYSVYYTEEEMKQLTMQTSGIYYGIGAYISFNESAQRAYISGIIANSPASESDLQENDIILYVDGTTTEGLKTDEVAMLVRGEEGTQVTLTVFRDTEEIDITLTRRKVESPTVNHEMKDAENGIGYLQITEFDDVTYAQFMEAYNDLKSSKIKELILDLRSNPGDNLNTICDIANELLPAGNIVYTVDKNGYKEEYKSDGKNEISIPMVVLVNQNSASASEILAGAIKDYEKGTLVGKKTFGKGIVQRIFFFEDGTGIKVTVSSYYTPNGINIHGEGIAPDVEVEYDADAYKADGTDTQLDKAMEVLKEKMK